MPWIKFKSLEIMSYLGQNCVLYRTSFCIEGLPLFIFSHIPYIQAHSPSYNVFANDFTVKRVLKIAWIHEAPPPYALYVILKINRRLFRFGLIGYIVCAHRFMKGTPRHIFQKGVNSPLYNITITNNN